MSNSQETPTQQSAGVGRRLARWFFRVFVIPTILGFGLTALGLWLTGIRIGLDVQRLIGEPACMPSFAYLWKPGMTHEPKVGDYVLARMPKTSLGVGAREGDRIVKKVAAITGDSVRIEGTELWINGNHTDRLWLAKSIPGKKPGDFDVDLKLQQGQMFLMGTTKESFDSRYWGAVNREAFLGYAIPLF
jgi:conjugal transfer pilin signal peptidase TrbI